MYGCSSFRATDVPTYVEHGPRTWGVAGKDVLMDTAATVSMSRWTCASPAAS